MKRTHHLQFCSSLRLKIRITVILLATVLCVFSFAGRSEAARFSGEYLLNVCMVDSAGKELVKGGKIACQGYISGVIDYHHMMRSFEGSEEMNAIDFCIPETESLNDIHLRVLTYLLKNKKMHGKFVAAPAVSMALYQAYPCKRR